LGRAIEDGTVSEGGTRRRGRPSIPGDLQRRRLVEAALRLLAKGPYERVGVADIVREAGMSTRSFYDHFASKEDLVTTIYEEQAVRFVDHIRALLERPLAESMGRKSVMHSFLEMIPRSAIDLERMGGRAGERIREVRRRGVVAITDSLHDLCVRMHARGEIPRVPERMVIELAVTGLEALTLRYYSDGRRDELLALQGPLLRAFLRALS
jgi:AcrR family transcriptional regulator